jgi:hypothetical protein
MLNRCEVQLNYSQIRQCTTFAPILTDYIEQTSLDVSSWPARLRNCYHLILSDPTSNLVRQYDFPVPLRCRKTSDTVFVAFACCRNLSDAFPHVVRISANR